jgi:hypothetical protein
MILGSLDLYFLHSGPQASVLDPGPAMRSSFEVAPQGSNAKLELSCMDAAKKILWFFVVGLLIIVVLLVSLISTAAACPQSAPADIWDPDHHWVYNDRIVDAELDHLKMHHTFSYTDTWAPNSNLANLVIFWRFP